MSTGSNAVLITGASSGIGAATARRLARAGYSIYATARHVDALTGLKQEGCQVLALDVTSEESRCSAVAEVEAREGSIRGLINNAGYSLSGALETLSLDAVRTQFETNVFGPLRLAQLVLPGMRAAGRGRIINLSSIAGKLTFPGGGAYHASKHALEALSDALRFEVQGFGIEVVIIEPGFIRSGFADAAVKTIAADNAGPYAAFDRAVAKATREAYVSGLLSKLAGEPDDVANVIQCALEAHSPKARYRVTASAHVLLTLRSLMSDPMWDLFLGQNYAHPGSRNG